jgi:hypothetical protein
VSTKHNSAKRAQTIAAALVKGGHYGPNDAARVAAMTLQAQAAWDRLTEEEQLAVCAGKRELSDFAGASNR